MDGWAWWLLLLGIGIGVFLAWLALASGAPLLEADERSWAESAPEAAPTTEPMPARRDARAEAAWISQTIERRGGVAPAPLVQEVLDLHRGWPAEGAPSWPEGAPSWPEGAPSWPDPDSPPPPSLPRPRT